MTIHTMLDRVLARKRLTVIGGVAVVTDALEYHQIDQVIPIFPEQQFFLDEIAPEKMKDANVLEIGLGSGVLSIGAIRAGAKRVTALEINPRAKNLAGFNIVLNGVDDRIAIVDGCNDIFRPVMDQSFDYIISNPPFEPTPPDQDYFYHSAAGPFGTDFLEKIFRDVDSYLSDSGHLQIVTMAPGDDQKPFMLTDLADQYLSGKTTVLVSAISLDFYKSVDWLPKKQLCTTAQAGRLKDLARQRGITRFYLCMIHYEKGVHSVRVEAAKRTYGHPMSALESESSEVLLEQ